MLTGNQIRVRFYKGRLVPRYVPAHDPAWRLVAEQLLEMFRGHEGQTRGELEEEIRDSFGNDPSQLVHQGLAKLLEDRCEFEVVSGHPPEQLREAVFGAAGRKRISPLPAEGVRHPFDRGEVLRQVAAELGQTVEAIEEGLFADLRSQQRLISFKDLTAERLLQRYNVALAQAALLRSTGVRVIIRDESPARFRQLLGQVKFRRLVCDVERSGRNACTLNLDGPLSLFSSTQKYGLQLALFLPAILQCKDFDLEADVLWGPQRKPVRFTLTPQDGLVSHRSDAGTYTPPELDMFVELFRKKVTEWEIAQEAEAIPLGEGFWVPDYRLIHRATQKPVYLEVLGFWRKASVEKHLQRLRRHATVPFLLAVSEQLRVDDSELDGLPAGIHRFRQMPLPDEVARLADTLLNDRK